MKILSIQIYKNPDQPVILCEAVQLSHFGYFQQGKVKEVITFAGRLLAERAEVGSASYEKGEYINYVLKRTSGITIIIATDREYPSRVAFTLLHKIALDFEAQFPKDEWTKPKYKSDCSLQWSELSDVLKRYQDPHEADDLLKVKQNLLEAKEIAHHTLEKVMERGEKMEHLVNKSNDLSLAAKMLYSASSDQNSCCILM